LHLFIFFLSNKAVSNEILIDVNQPFVSIKITPNAGVSNVMVEVNGCFVTGNFFFIK
jgi:hypothetical protein